MKFRVRTYLSSERHRSDKVMRYLFAVFYHSILPLIIFYAFLLTDDKWVVLKVMLIMILAFLVFVHFELGES